MENEAQLRNELAHIELLRQLLEVKEKKLLLAKKELDVKRQLGQYCHPPITGAASVQLKEEPHDDTKASLEGKGFSSQMAQPGYHGPVFSTMNNTRTQVEDMISTERLAAENQIQNIPVAALQQYTVPDRDAESVAPLSDPRSNSADEPHRLLQSIPNRVDGSRATRSLTPLESPGKSSQSPPPPWRRSIPNYQSFPSRPKRDRTPDGGDVKSLIGGEIGGDRKYKTARFENCSPSRSLRKTSALWNSTRYSSSGPSEQERRQLVSQYAELLLGRLQTIKRPWVLSGGSFTFDTILQILHASTQESHQCLELVHTRFNAIVETQVEDPELRAELQREITKFEKALPYWVPFCKGFVHQDSRLRSVHTMFHRISHGTFDKRLLQQYYDENDKL